MGAIASGVVSASSRVLLASTRQTWISNPLHWGVCQKRHSNFIDLVVEWRENLELEGGGNTTVSLFDQRTGKLVFGDFGICGLIGKRGRHSPPRWA